MIESLKSLFMSQPEEDPAALEHRLRLAAAALLIEVSRADYTVDSSELRTIKMVLQTALGISQQEIDELVALAGKAADKANMNTPQLARDMVSSKNPTPMANTTR